MVLGLVTHMLGSGMTFEDAKYEPHRISCCDLSVPRTLHRVSKGSENNYTAKKGT